MADVNEVNNKGAECALKKPSKRLLLVTDIFAFHYKNYLLTKIFGVIANPLKAFGDDAEVKAAADVIRLGLHQLGELSLIRVIQLVDLPVARNDAPCQDGVTNNECVECVLEHGVDQEGHLRDIQRGVQRGQGH